MADVGRRLASSVANGRTELGTLGFHEQLLLARKILLYVVLLLVIAWLATAVIGATELAPCLLFGFDGIAFDQVSIVGMVWSSIVAAVVLLMLVRAGHGGRVMLFDILRELAARSAWLLPAIVAVTALHVALSAGQSSVKGIVYLYWQTSAPYSVKNLVYLAFVLGFASLRLWVTLAVLTFALRESYRRGELT